MYYVATSWLFSYPLYGQSCPNAYINDPMSVHVANYGKTIATSMYKKIEKKIGKKIEKRK